jgi:6-phosphogluconolactonase (cycloisomerase 2 family)
MRNDGEGCVYVQTNDADDNEVVVFGRGPDGTLRRLDSYLTGGKGSGSPHLQSQGSIVFSEGRLFVTNAGSDDLTVFSADGGQLEVVNRAASGGRAPRSLAVHDGHVYVLNTGGSHPGIAVFSFDGKRLVPVTEATRLLDAGSDPAQVAITPDGATLLVTDRAIDAIHAFAVADDGRLVDVAVTHRSSGATPYGFDVSADGVVVVTEAAGAQVGKASASSYKVEGAAQLSVVSGAVPNTRSEVCWAVIGNDGRTAFVTNFGDGTISSYSIGEDGSIELREAVAATTVDGRPGIRDEALSADGRYLYALHADTGQVFGWAVQVDGSLTAVGSANGLPLTAAGLAAS